MITYTMLSCWEPSESVTGEAPPFFSSFFARCLISFVVGVKVLVDQAPETHGNMQGAKDSFGSLPYFVRPSIQLSMRRA